MAHYKIIPYPTYQLPSKAVHSCAMVVPILPFQFLGPINVKVVLRGFIIPKSMGFVATYATLAIIEIQNRHWVQKMTTRAHLTRTQNMMLRRHGLPLMLHRIDAIRANQENSSLINKQAHVLIVQKVNTEMLGWPQHVKIVQLDNS